MPAKYMRLSWWMLAIVLLYGERFYMLLGLWHMAVLVC